MRAQRFSVMKGTWAVVRLGPTVMTPSWAADAPGFVSITRTHEELSVVCPASAVPDDVRVESGWAILRLEGPFAFQQVGILASFAAPLAAASISLFAISTFDTDYILVKSADLPAACEALTAAGHELRP
jgi:hypothetical protein